MEDVVNSPVHCNQFTSFLKLGQIDRGSKLDICVTFAVKLFEFKKNLKISIKGQEEATKVAHQKITINNKQNLDEVGICKEESIVIEKQGTLTVELVLNIFPDKEHVEENISEPINKDDKCSSPKNINPQSLSQTSGNASLSSSKITDKMEAPKVATEEFMLESYNSRVNESCGSVDIFQAIGDGDRTASKVTDNDITKDDGVLWQSGGNVLDSHNSDGTTVANESEISKTLPAVSNDMEVCNAETTKEVHVSNIGHMADINVSNVSTKQFERDCISEHSSHINKDNTTQSFLNRSGTYPLSSQKPNIAIKFLSSEI
uniref:C2 NT-type domain-containing protein n=1 Tax=Strongyloides papillosus TaxID=174720 RepID=A0A0N5C4W0_STREA